MFPRLCAPDWWDDLDDASRLVHADVLTTRGDPRGEFILLQCTQPTAPRIAELWAAHHVQWLAEQGLPPLGWFVKGPGLSSAMHRVNSNFELWSVHFQRGHLTSLWAPRLDERLKRQLLDAGTVRHLELDDCDPDRFLETIRGFRLEGLGVGGPLPLSERRLEALVASDEFVGLAELDFNAGTPFAEADARAMFILREAGRAPRLTRLRLEGTLTARPLRYLRELAWTRRLTHLDVSTSDAVEEVAPVLAHLPRLESISLSVFRSSPEVAQALLAHPTLRRARIRTNIPTPLPGSLAAQLEARFGPQALARL